MPSIMGRRQGLPQCSNVGQSVVSTGKSTPSAGNYILACTAILYVHRYGQSSYSTLAPTPFKGQRVSRILFLDPTYSVLMVVCAQFCSFQLATKSTLRPSC